MHDLAGRWVALASRATRRLALLLILLMLGRVAEPLTAAGQGVPPSDARAPSFGTPSTRTDEPLYLPSYESIGPKPALQGVPAGGAPRETAPPGTAPTETAPPPAPEGGRTLGETASTGKGQRPEAIEQIHVRAYRFVGSTAIGSDELALVAAPYAGRTIAFEDLEALRHAVTLLYVERGYVNSGAVIPDQAIEDGVVTIQIVEGRLSRIEVSGNRWLRESYIQSRIERYVTTPLDITELEAGLELLQQNPHIRRVNAELRPGLRAGDAVLEAAVEDVIPLSLALAVDNYQSPDIGSLRGSVYASDASLTGHGDTLGFGFDGTEGLRDYQAEYRLPVTASDTEVGVRYRYSDAKVVQQPFDTLDIDSVTSLWGAGVFQPLYRTLRRQIDGSMVFERRASRTFLLGQRFAFSPGAVDGKQVVSVLRLTGEWTERSPVQVLAARGVLSIGVDLFGATINGASLPDSHFVAFLGQFQLARRLPWLEAQTIFRFDVQLTPFRLLSLEQFAIGGPYSIRGYLQNQIVRDNGVVGSIELRVPVLNDLPGIQLLELAAFSDLGGAWLTRVTPPSSKGPASASPPSDFLASVGGGLRWLIFGATSFSLYGGIPLAGPEVTGSDLQAYGVTFRLLTELGLPEAATGVLPEFRSTRPMTGLNR